MDGGYFKGTTTEQDSRFIQSNNKLMKQMKFSNVLETKIDMSKVDFEAVKPWINQRLTELLGFEDDVIVSYVFNQMDTRYPNPKEIQLNLTGFLNAKNSRLFLAELWQLLISANNEKGVPMSLIEAQLNEIKKNEEDEKAIQMRLKAEAERKMAEEQEKLSALQQSEEKTFKSERNYRRNKETSPYRNDHNNRDRRSPEVRREERRHRSRDNRNNRFEEKRQRSRDERYREDDRNERRQRERSPDKPRSRDDRSRNDNQYKHTILSEEYNDIDPVRSPVQKEIWKDESDEEIKEPIRQKSKSLETRRSRDKWAGGNNNKEYENRSPELRRPRDRWTNDRMKFKSKSPDMNMRSRDRWVNDNNNNRGEYKSFDKPRRDYRRNDHYSPNMRPRNEPRRRSRSNQMRRDRRNNYDGRRNSPEPPRYNEMVIPKSRSPVQKETWNNDSGSGSETKKRRTTADDEDILRKHNIKSMYADRIDHDSRREQRSRHQPRDRYEAPVVSKRPRKYSPSERRSNGESHHIHREDSAERIAKKIRQDQSMNNKVIKNKKKSVSSPSESSSSNSSSSGSSESESEDSGSDSDESNTNAKSSTSDSTASDSDSSNTEQSKSSTSVRKNSHSSSTSSKLRERERILRQKALQSLKTKRN